jgi:hypothetical protein
MDTSVLVEMPRLVEAGRLMEKLAASGLTANLVSADGGWEVEIRSVLEDTEQVADEVESLLDALLAERGLPFIPVRVGERTFAVRPPAD